MAWKSNCKPRGTFFKYLKISFTFLFARSKLHNDHNKESQKKTDSQNPRLWDFSTESSDRHWLWESRDSVLTSRGMRQSSLGSTHTLRMLLLPSIIWLRAYIPCTTKAPTSIRYQITLYGFEYIFAKFAWFWYNL